VADVYVFAIPAFARIGLRKRPEFNRRLTLLSLMVLLPAGIARLSVPLKGWSPGSRTSMHPYVAPTPSLKWPFTAVAHEDYWAI
jgi:hypothetical protein